MAFTLVPDYKFDKFSDVTAEFLSSLGIKGLILDIDNTLEPYEHPLPGEEVRAWLDALSEAGINCAFVSNNGRERVEKFNESLGKVAFYKAGKPFSKNVKKAMALIGSDKQSTALMGDQVFTDVWAARNSGIVAILVPPIKDKTDAFTKFKRLLERPILKKYERKKK